MEIILTGKNFGADEAEAWGVGRVVREGSVLDEAIKIGKEISGKGRLSVIAGKEAVNASYELNLAEGLRFERRIFHGLFATNDQKEGA